MFRTTLAIACLLSLSACFSSRSKPAKPHYESAGIRVFKTSPDRMGKKGHYVFGGLLIESKDSPAPDTRFALTMEYGRDVNGNGLLETEEVMDTHRIQDGSLPFTYRVEELQIPKGAGRAITNVRVEFAGEPAFRYERREIAASTPAK